MPYFFLQVADWFFLIFHTLWTLFNITGWMFRKTRKIHLITMSLTAFSWFVLGLRYGIGLCVCTEWHWQIRALMNKPIRSRSYIQFLIRELTGLTLNPRFVDVTVMVVFTVTILLTIVVNVRDFKRNRKNR